MSLMAKLKKGEGGKDIDLAVWNAVSGNMEGEPPPISTDLNATIAFLKKGWPALLFRVEMLPVGWSASIKTPSHKDFVLRQSAPTPQAALLSALVYAETGITAA